MSGRYTYPEAAEKLRISEDWLRKHIKQLPRTKVGRTVYFTDDDLARIDQLFHIEPSTGPLAVVSAPASKSTTHPMGHLKPLPSRGAAVRTG